MPDFEYSYVCDVGLVRTNNEDAILCNEDLGLWLVADGMGGHAAGEVASKVAIGSVAHALQNGKDLSSAIAEAHAAVLASASSGEGKYGMGCTIVALHSTNNHYHIAWVGDSRAYLWGAGQTQEFELNQITTDHSYVQMLFQSGIISAEEVDTHPDKNIITQCLGSNELDQVQVDMIDGTWRPNDWLLLCSDGLTDTVSDQAISEILYRSPTPTFAVDTLLQEALKNGGKDNISIIIVGYKNSFTSKLKNTIKKSLGLENK